MTWVNGVVRLELEDRETLAALPDVPRSFATASIPDEVSVDWHKHENQGRLGSCQGNALTSCLERLQFVRTRDRSKVEQLSRIFGYLATQKIDGLLGRDQGSTISGGVKLALNDGVPPESNTGYPSQYPASSDRSRILSRSNYEAGAPYKAVSSWRVTDDAVDARQFIGGGGAISLGIKWHSGLIPRSRIVTRFSGGGGGGHAVAALGYERNGNIVCVNSHGDGEFQVTPDAWRQMVRHSWSAFIGLLGTQEPEPVDWFNENPSFA